MAGEVAVAAESGGGSAAFLGPPSSSANTKLKLPADTGAAGKILGVKSANHSSTNAELEWAAAGKILQVVQCIKHDTWTEASVAEGGFSAVISGLTQAFQCSSTSSKVLIQGMLHCENPVGGGWGVGAVITADGSTITAATGNARGSNRTRLHSEMPSNYLGNNLPIQYLHSPSSTSSITYGIKLWNGHTSAATMVLNYGSSADSDVNNSMSTVSTLIFMEVAG